MAKKIMIVDDEESLIELLLAILQEAGYDVETARSGEECLEKMERMKPDLILLDMMMPGISGRETCEKIRSNKEMKNQKVAFLTVARFSEIGKDTLKELKVLDYITKPFDNDDLLKKVKKMIG